MEFHAATSQAISRSYVRRAPEHGVLHRVVVEHLRTFLWELDRQGDERGAPLFVKREFQRFVRCGILANGFARFSCTGCGTDRLVAFSCKGRGFCPSCGGRRMVERAAHLIDHVLPGASVRQWVLSLPKNRRKLTWNYERNGMRAFQSACWYSWPAQRQSLIGLAEYRFERLFSGHGPWTPRRDANAMRQLLLELTERM